MNAPDIFKTASIGGALFLVVLIGGASRAEGRTKATSAITSARHSNAIQKARALTKTMKERARIPGMSIAVGIHGKIVWSEGFGFADLEQGVPATRSTRYRIGSVSKPITAAAIGLLHQKGLLNLDKPVQAYLPQYPRKRWPITTRQLAGHLAGIRHYRNREFVSAVHYSSVTEGLKIFQDDSLLHEPGTKFAYTSYGYNLMSAVIEGAAKEEFLPYMQKNVFRPLGMNQTTADNNFAVIKNRTRFYSRRRDGELVNATYVDCSNKWASGGLLSTAEDLVRFGSAHLRKDFLSPKTVQLLWTPQVTTHGKATKYGIGWSIGKDRHGRRLAGHLGGSQGGTTGLRVYRDDKFVLTFVSNIGSVRNLNRYLDQITESFLNRKVSRR